MKWYHITTYYRGKTFKFDPSIPYYLRAGEDRRNARVCVTANWQHSLRSIILIKRSQEYYVYSTSVMPVNPITKREQLLKEKKIRKNSNDFKVLEDGVINKEHWFTESINMELEGVVELSKRDYAGMLMGFGFMNEPDVTKLKIKPYIEKSIEERLKERLGRFKI